LRLFSFGVYGLALAALALVVFGAIECPPFSSSFRHSKYERDHEFIEPGGIKTNSSIIGCRQEQGMGLSKTGVRFLTAGPCLERRQERRRFAVFIYKSR